MQPWVSSRLLHCVVVPRDHPMTIEDDAQRLWLLHSLRRYRDLEVYARECIARHPDWGVPYSYLGQALADLDRPEEGIEPTKVGVRKCPHDPWVQAGLAFVLMRAGRYEQAKRVAEEALRLDPNYLWGYTLLAHAERNLRAYRRAVRVARRGLTIDPNSETLLIELGLALAALGDTDEAEDVAEHGLKRHPDSPRLHNLIGLLNYGKALQPQNWTLKHARRAERHFAEAVRLQPTDPDFQVNREWNAVVARKSALGFVLVAAGSFAVLQFALTSLAAITNAKFTLMVVPVVLHLGWLLLATLWVNRSRTAILSAPLDRFDIPGIPLPPAERRVGRLRWVVILIVQLALMVTAVGFGIHAGCYL
jgi:tetratricopeptide (TPR) repeat protein